jgi:hypothetical protein
MSCEHCNIMGIEHKLRKEAAKAAREAKQDAARAKATARELADAARLLADARQSLRRANTYEVYEATRAVALLTLRDTQALATCREGAALRAGLLDVARDCQAAMGFSV